MQNKAKEVTNKLTLEWCKTHGFICYECPQCGLLTMGLATSYHEQKHGHQDIHYNPLPKYPSTGCVIK